MRNYADLVERANRVMQAYGYITRNLMDSDPELSRNFTGPHDFRSLMARLLHKHKDLILFQVPNRPGGLVVVCHWSDRKRVTNEIHRLRKDKEGDARPLMDTFPYQFRQAWERANPGLVFDESNEHDKPILEEKLRSAMNEERKLDRMDDP